VARNYDHTTTPVFNSAGSSALIRAEFDKIEVGFTATDVEMDAKATKTGDTYTGTHDMTAATVNVGTPSTALNAVNKTYADSLAIAAMIPGMGGSQGQVPYSAGASALWTSGGNAGEFLQRSSGTNAPVWGPVKFPPITRSSNITLGAADRSKYIVATAGYVQILAPAATLGDGWFCFMKNSVQNALVTIDPDASELIDGLGECGMYPNEVRMIFCDGAAFKTIVLSPFFAVYTASDTFYKPPGYSLFAGLIWGGGSPGGRGAVSNYGGGGGACAPFTKTASSVGATESVVVGSSTGGRTTDGAPPAGSDSSFLGFTAKGGVGGSGGYGGKAYDIGPSGGNAITGGGGLNLLTLYGGAPGNDGTAGIGSVYGGGGGGNTANTAATPTIFGGTGGVGANSTNGGDGVAPGGGGGATTSGTKSGDGARGQVWVWGIV
jgi:hypothetical protein